MTIRTLQHERGGASGTLTVSPEVEDGDPDAFVVEQAGFPHAVVTKDRAKHHNTGFNDERHVVLGETSTAGVAAKVWSTREMSPGDFQQWKEWLLAKHSGEMVCHRCLLAGRIDGRERPNTRDPSNPQSLHETATCVARVGFSPRTF